LVEDPINKEFNLNSCSECRKTKENTLVIAIESSSKLVKVSSLSKFLIVIICERVYLVED